MKLKLSQKLSLAFGTLLAVVLTFSGVLVYTTVEDEITDTLNNHLNTTTDLIKRIVETSVDNNWGQLRKNIRFARYIVGEQVDFAQEQTHTYETYNETRQEYGTITLPELRIHDEVVSKSGPFVESIAGKTDSIVTVYQKAEQGYVAVASTLGDDPARRGTGHLIPDGSPMDKLITRNETYTGRDYFRSAWHLVAYAHLYDGSELAGALFVAIKQVDLAALREDILSIVVGNTGFPFVIDTVSNVIIHPELEGKNLFYLPHMRKISFQRNGRMEYPHRTGDGTQQYVASYKLIPAMNWIVIAATAKKDFFGTLHIVRTLMFLIFGFALASSLVLSFILGRRVTKPVSVITEKIKEISEGDGDLSSQLDVHSNDEIGELSLYFNNFVSKVRNLKEVEQREIEVLLRDAQMNALQAQINPHFLYNTLETVRFMISMHDERAIRIVQHLADLFRISIGKGERYVRVQRELDHVKLYLDIQQMRYPEKFTVNFDVDASVRRLYVLKFILQPLVENAVHHAFAQLESDGVIDIEAHIADGRLYMHVRDNGCGMDAPTLEQVRRQLDPQLQAGSVGLVNVHERIQLHFADPFGLSITSEEGRGTEVLLTLPILRDKPNALRLYKNENRKAARARERHYV